MKLPASLLRATLAAAILLSAAAQAQAPGDIRIALVIGNSAYTGAPALVNPANDAKAMGDALRGLGFTVVEVRDADKAQMARAIAQVRDSLKGKQGVGMLYYAGHGLQVDARNYMVPVDAKMAKGADVPAQTVDVSSVIDAFKAAGNRMNILVLDACRDNPFGGITTGKGLAPLDAPSGTFLAYATAPGNVAEDGDVKTGNGLYTQFLLQELKKPQASIENVFKRVRFAVRKASNGRQIPWESTSLEDDFQFNDGRVVAIAKPTPQQLQAEFSQEKGDWERIKDSSKADDFYAFIQKYPSGSITESAHARLNILTRPTLEVQGGGADGASAGYSPPRFRVGDSYVERRSSANSKPEDDGYRVTSVNEREVQVEARIGSTGTAMTMFYTPDGASTGTNYSRFDPPQPYVPAGPLQTGQRWRTAYSAVGQGSNLAVTGEGQILGREKLTVPAGTFDSFKLRQTFDIPVRGQANMKIDCTVWVSSSLPVPLKKECDVGMGSKMVTELARYTRGG